MYSIEKNKLTYWFATEEFLNEALESNGRKMLQMADFVLDNNTWELVKCRYDLQEIIQDFMSRKVKEEDKLEKYAKFAAEYCPQENNT